MCRNHLLEEHSEIHLFVWNINAEHSVRGYIDKGLLEIHNLYNRHAELARELRGRRCMHNSELDAKWKMAKNDGSIDRQKKPKRPNRKMHKMPGKIRKIRCDRERSLINPGSRLRSGESLQPKKTATGSNLLFQYRVEFTNLMSI